MGWGGKHVQSEKGKGCESQLVPSASHRKTRELSKKEPLQKILAFLSHHGPHTIPNL